MPGCALLPLDTEYCNYDALAHCLRNCCGADFQYGKWMICCISQLCTNLVLLILLISFSYQGYLLSLFISLSPVSERNIIFSLRLHHNCSHMERKHTWPRGWIAFEPLRVSWASEPLSLTQDRGLLVDAVWLLSWVPSLCFIQKHPTRSKQLSPFPNYRLPPSPQQSHALLWFLWALRKQMRDWYSA